MLKKNYRTFLAGIMLLLMVQLAIAQNRTLSGVIKDDKGSLIEGATVSIKGTKTATTTDASGKFKINIPANGNRIVVSHVSHRSQEVAFGNKPEITITLQSLAHDLEDVVVIGYGTVKKKDLTGSVSTITAKDLNQGPVMSPLQQIAGKAAGVSIIQVGSEPGTAPGVRIRGVTSLLGGSDPLVVIDGMQGDLTILLQVPPNDIESVDILKDASASAIYGARGAAGVIIVTTKAAKAGKSQVELNSFVSVDVIRKKLEMLEAKEYWEVGQKYNPGLPGDVNFGANTDWFGILTRTGITQNHSLSISGGSANFNYRATVSAQTQNGIVIRSNFKSYIANFQATQKALNNKLTITFQANNNVLQKQASPGNVGRAAFSSNLISNAYLTRPTDPVFNPDGSYFTDPNLFAYINPYAVAIETINENESNKFFTSLRAAYKITNDLTVNWFGVWRKSDDLGGSYTSAKTTLPNAITDSGQASIYNNIYQERLTNMGFNYKKAIKNHSIEAIAVFEYQKQIPRGSSINARSFPTDINNWHQIQLGSSNDGRVYPNDRSSYKSERELQSVLARVNYSYMNRYLLTASIRRDGSSVFGDNFKYGNFPSGSFAWRIDEEPFMADIRIINSLKLRVSYGVTGNQGVGAYESKYLVGGGSVTAYRGSIVRNFDVTQNPNPNLRWETKTQTNLAIDFGLYKDKITGSIDVYRAVTSNLLYRYSVPVPPFPHNNIMANVGSLQNEGVEISLNYKAINNRDVTLTLGGNISFLRNKVLNLSGTIPLPGSETETIPIATATKYVGWGQNSFLSVGHSIGIIRIFQHKGFNDDGGEEIADLNKSGVIEGNTEGGDMYFAGSTLPTHTFAFSPSLTWKRLNVSMLFRGQAGNYLYNNLRLFMSNVLNVGKTNILKSAAHLGLKNPQYSSDYWLEKGDFLRLENLTVGYNFNASKLNGVDVLRLSFTAMNLFILTKYSGIDPELNTNGGNGSGSDSGMYPRTSNFSLGLTVVFK